MDKFEQDQDQSEFEDAVDPQEPAKPRWVVEEIVVILAMVIGDLVTPGGKRILNGPKTVEGNKKRNTFWGQVSVLVTNEKGVHRTGDECSRKLGKVNQEYLGRLRHIKGYRRWTPYDAQSV